MSTDDALYGLIKRAVLDALRELRAPEGEPEPELVKLSDAAKRLQVSESWLKSRIADGSLPVYGKLRMRRVKPAEVRALLARRAAPAAPEAPSARAQVILSSLTGGRR